MLNDYRINNLAVHSGGYSHFDPLNYSKHSINYRRIPAFSLL